MVQESGAPVVQQPGGPGQQDNADQVGQEDDAQLPPHDGKDTDQIHQLEVENVDDNLETGEADK